MRFTWWKISAMLIILATIIAAYIVPIPNLPIIKESIRNLYFHVTLWMTMAAMQIFAVVHAVKYLQKQQLENDAKSNAFTTVSMLFGLLGYCTGFVWASYTWSMKSDDPVFTTDIFREPKLIGAGICLLAYGGYFVFRSSLPDTITKAKMSAVYNIFAFAIMIPSIYVVPRMYDSLHPGGSGSPVFGRSDLDTAMRIVFWPAVFGYICLAYWMANILTRIAVLQLKRKELI
jgi:heme exporter protein C